MTNLECGCPTLRGFRRVGIRQAGLWEEEEHFWQERYFDFNVWSEKKRNEKLNYTCTGTP